MKKRIITVIVAARPRSSRLDAAARPQPPSRCSIRPAAFSCGTTTATSSRERYGPQTLRSSARFRHAHRADDRVQQLSLYWDPLALCFPDPPGGWTCNLLGGETTLNFQGTIYDAPGQ